MVDKVRIAEAIRVMTEVRDRNLPFDMQNWFRGDADDCGTAACFGGWLVRDPYFQALGLTGERDNMPYFDGFAGTDAIEDILVISNEQARDLCYENYYQAWSHDKPITPDHVIQKLEALLNE